MMLNYDHDSGRIYDPTDDETIGYLDAQPKSRGLKMAAADDLLEALQGLMLYILDDVLEKQKQGLKIGPYEAAHAAIAKTREE